MRSPGIPAWDDVADEMKPILARQMEVYAGFLENTDHHIGEVLNALEDLKILDETLIITIIGDNGASAEGSLQGTFNEMITLGGFGGAGDAGVPADQDRRARRAGGLQPLRGRLGARDGHAVPVDQAGRLALRRHPQRHDRALAGPDRGQGRDPRQFHHVIDVAPTILEAAGLPQPTFVNGVMQKPIEGVAMNYSFDDAAAPERHETQYFEMFGNRGIYHKGWTAVTKHRTPWETGRRRQGAGVRRRRVGALRHDDGLDAGARPRRRAPEKLHELQRLWLIEAVKYNVVPLDDRFVERGLPETAGRPTLVSGKRQLLFGGMGRLTENSVLMMKNTSFSLTAQVKVPEGGAEGVIVAQGGVTGGHSLYVKDGKPKYAYNFFGLDEYAVAGTEAVPPGEHQVRMEFTYDGGGVGKGGDVTLYIDGNAVGSGHIERTEAFLFSADETCDVGDEYGSPVTHDYAQRRRSPARSSGSRSTSASTTTTT